MKTTWCWLLLSIAAGGGCVNLPGTWGPGGKPPTAPAKVRTPPRDVTKDDVNETNAREQAEALRRELDRDAVSDNGPAAEDGPPKPKGR